MALTFALSHALFSSLTLTHTHALSFIQDHDDDDEMYYAFFNADASPVATPHGFAKILEDMPVGSRVLDVGIGSGTYLEHAPVQEIISRKQLRVDGVDISIPNVAICQDRIEKHRLQGNVTVRVQDARTIEEVGVYDAILFMESFPCMSKPLFIDILQSVQRLLKPAGSNYLYHNLADPKGMSSLEIAAGRLIKPSLKLFVGIDFGRLTSKVEQMQVIQQALPGCKVTDTILLSALPSEVNAQVVLSHLDKVSNKWYAFMGRIFLAAMRNGGPRMEQHLITIPADHNAAKPRYHTRTL